MASAIVVDNDNRQWFEVEDIRDEKRVRGVTKFLVKWKGWPESGIIHHADDQMVWYDDNEW